MSSKWQRSIYWRAFEDARSSIGFETGERALIAVAIVVIAFIFVWLAEGWDIAKSQVPIILSSSITFILIFSLVYVRKLFTIPEKPVQIIIGKDAPFETVEPSGLNRARVVRVKLQNNIPAVISKGKLQVLNLDPDNNGHKDFPLKDDISLGPKGHTFVEVVSYHEGTSEAPAGPWIRLSIPIGVEYSGVSLLGNLPLRSHKFCLKFSSLDDIFDEIYCRIFLDSDHIIHLEEWN